MEGKRLPPCPWVGRLRAHLLGPMVTKLAGGAHELPEPLVCPGIEVIPRIDRELAGFAERWTVTGAGVLRKSRGYARDAVGLADVAGGFCPPDVQSRLRFHVRTPVIVCYRRSMMRAYPVPVIWKGLGRLTPGSGSVFPLP